MEDLLEDKDEDIVAKEGYFVKKEAENIGRGRECESGSRGRGGRGNLFDANKHGYISALDHI